MRIIEVISDTNIGGAGILLCERLSCKNPFRESTLVILPRNSALTSRLRSAGVQTLELNVAPDTSFCISDIKKYTEIFRSLRPHIVNTHACLSARIAAYLCSVPVKLCTRHCIFSPSLHERIFLRFSSLFCDRFIAVAECVKKQLADMGVPKHKISVVINGARPLTRLLADDRVKIKKALDIPEGATVLIMCARLEKYKDHACLFRALRILNEKGERVVALVVGEGSEKERLKDMAVNLKIQKNIRLLGFCQDVAPYYNIADININCSVGTETSSLALSEGMSLGLPAIVSDFGGNPYMVRDGKNGFVFRQGDARELADAVCMLIHDRELYGRMSRAALERYREELDINRSTQKTNAIYRECLSAYRKKRSKV